MNEILLSDYFDVYDQAFYAVCDDLGIKKIPSWKQKWLFRYLQISTSRFTLNSISEGKLPLNYEEKIPAIENVKIFSSVIPLDHKNHLHDWWFPDGMRFFNKLAKLDFTEIGSVIPVPELVNRDAYFNLKESFDSYLASIYGDKESPPALLVGFKFSANKKQLMSEFEEFLDKTFNFNLGLTLADGYLFEKSKIQEKSLRDCYRALEVRIRNPGSDLLDVAFAANTLGISLEGFNRNEESNQSIRSGISRQIKNAHRISENSSRGMFPTDLNYENLPINKDFLNDFFSSFYFLDDSYQEIYDAISQDLEKKIQVCQDIF